MLKSLHRCFCLVSSFKQCARPVITYAYSLWYMPIHKHADLKTRNFQLATQSQVQTHTQTHTQINTDTHVHTPDLNFHTHENGVSHVTLNRPKSLNAMTFEMVTDIKRFLKQKHKDNTCNGIVVTGYGDKAFCAGGDIRALKALGENGVAEFFKNEYIMNLWTNYISVPYASIWKGIVMGGGVGMSIHGKYRVATNTTMFAMPETAIGLFPDIGSSYFLSHMERPLIGLYLGLTGVRLNAADVIKLKLATHYVDEQNIPIVLKKLSAINFTRQDKFEAVENVLSEESSSPSVQPTLSEKDLHTIESHLTKCKSLNEYLDLLEEEKNDPFAADILKKMKTLCPVSCAVWWEAFHRGKSLSLIEAFEMEYALVKAMVLDTPNFKEGVDALLVRKCKQPTWKPKLFSELDTKRINKLFTKRPTEKLFQDLT